MDGNTTGLAPACSAIISYRPVLASEVVYSRQPWLSRDGPGPPSLSKEALEPAWPGLGLMSMDSGIGLWRGPPDGQAHLPEASVASDRCESPRPPAFTQPFPALLLLPGQAALGLGSPAKPPAGRMMDGAASALA